jgi:hypothetical protein
MHCPIFACRDNEPLQEQVFDKLLAYLHREFNSEVRAAARVSRRRTDVGSLVTPRLGGANICALQVVVKYEGRVLKPGERGLDVGMQEAVEDAEADEVPRVQVDVYPGSGNGAT